MDIDDDGKLDVILQEVNESGVPMVQMIYNNVVTDSFFLKAMTLNTEPQGTDSAQYYGDVAIGVTYRFIVTSLSDRKFVLLGN